MSDVYRKQGEVEPEVRVFPLENLLTVSARDYCESVGKKLSDYEMRGVHREGFSELKNFAKMVPENAEVVVDYVFIRSSNTGNYMNASGTALIPNEELPNTGGPIPRY